MSITIEPIFTHLMAGVAGGLIGAIVTHFLTKSRERGKDSVTRIADFVAFLRKWQEQVKAYPLEAGRFYSAYQDSWPALREAAGKIEPCFTTRKNRTFRNKVDDTCRACAHNLPSNVGDVEAAKKRIFDAIVSLESFAKQNGYGRWFTL